MAGRRLPRNRELMPPLEVVRAVAAYPDELPPGFAWRTVEEWTCPVHAQPLAAWYDADEDEPFDFDFTPYGCTCGRGARWQETGEHIVVLASAGVVDMSEIIRELYTPQVVEQLNSECLFTALLEREEES